MNYDTLLDHRWGRLTALLLILVLPFAIAACDSQLEQQTFGQIEQGQFPSNASEFRSSAAAAYAPLRNLQFAPLNISEHTTDETMVPTRGGDWADGGQWRRLTQHQWTATHPDLNPAWGTLQTGVSRTNSLLTTVDAAEGLSDEQKSGFSAEMRFLRAYYYYWLMDLWGGVPVVVEAGNEQYDFITQEEVSTDNRPPHNTRKQVFDFLLQELVGVNSENLSVEDVNNPGDGSVLANLSPKGEIEYGRATRGAGYGLLARLLLNAEVYGVEVGGPNAQDIGPLANATGPALYEEAVAAADQVLNSGRYELADDYFEPFSVDNAGNDEILFAATYNAKSGQGYQLEQAVLHYNQPWKQGPWNGFTTIADFYNSYDNVGNNDVRQDQFMVGPQYEQPNQSCAGDECFSDPSSPPVLARNSDQQINFTPEVPNLILEGGTKALEEPGARPLKFELDPNAAASHMGNDFPLIRLAEIYMIKAEALTAMDQVGAATTPFNTVRTRTGADALTGTPSASEMYELILQERGFEFHFEMLRRQDMIRYEFAHGMDRSDEPYAPSFTGPWRFKQSPSDNFRALFPIPENQLSVNPELAQNP
ncbi:MAG: RagB/SusD family nutrient uptake outer membrane protein, partial [Salinivenus sp.]